MSGYQQAILEIVGPGVDLGAVEAAMRLEYRTLDGLTKRKFNATARAAAEYVRQNPAGARRLAETYGL